MKTSDHLDRIFKLGFWITLNWNEDFEIYYNASDVVPATAYSICVLRCSYYKSESSPYTYEQMIEVCCDLFYSWYNKNLSLIKDFDKSYDTKSMEKLEDKCLGEVTKIVARELKLDDIIGLFTEE
jgi:hypothetical protein